jgi:hypothetical protein
VGRKSREKRERRARAQVAPTFEAARRLAGVEAGQGALEEEPGLVGGLSNGRPYALVERPELLDQRDPPRPTWRRVWLKPGRLCRG